MRRDTKVKSVAKIFAPRLVAALCGQLQRTWQTTERTGRQTDGLATQGTHRTRRTTQCTVVQYAWKRRPKFSFYIQVEYVI